MHFLHSHFEFFAEKFGAVSDEQGERFHQDIQAMKEMYQGVGYEGIMSEFCLKFYRDDPTHSYKWGNRMPNLLLNLRLGTGINCCTK